MQQLQIQEHIPAKQGLKLAIVSTEVNPNFQIQEHIPAKQGLKHLKAA